jgi:hypothetical protein
MVHTKLGCKKHIFIHDSGIHIGKGNFSYYGHCRECGMKMRMIGKTDDVNDGWAIVISDDNAYRSRKIISGGSIIDDPRAEID